MCEFGDVKRLGPLGQRWATLWRTVFGARLGIYRTSQVGERRGFKKGTYVACKAGILAAAENAVLAKNVESAWSVDDNEDRSTLFKSAHGDESFNNQKLTRFAEASKLGMPRQRSSNRRNNRQLIRHRGQISRVTP